MAESRGEAFEAAVLETYDPSPGERVLLGEAARTIDLIAAVAESDIPFDRKARELRSQRLCLARLLSGLDFPDIESQAQRRGRRAAQERWDPQRRLREASA